jgi:hypothetical protein
MGHTLYRLNFSVKKLAMAFYHYNPSTAINEFSQKFVGKSQICGRNLKIPTIDFV